MRFLEVVKAVKMKIIITCPFAKYERAPKNVFCPSGAKGWCNSGEREVV